MPVRNDLPGMVLPAATPHRLAPQLAPGADNPPADPDLARLVEAWPALPAHIKAAVLALLASSGG